MNHTNDKSGTFICSQCYKIFSQKDDLIKHRMMHDGEEPYHCFHCKDSFSLKYNLDEHMKKCGGKYEEKPYKCKQCGKTFQQNEHLIIHTRTHTGEKPFQCNWCDKAYIDKGGLRDHLKLHTEEKAHKCSYCNKEFMRLSHFNRHMNTHTLEKLYPCSQCNSTFLQIANLKSHLRTVHAEQTEPIKFKNRDKEKQDNYISHACPQKRIHITHLKTHASSPEVWLGRIKQSSECNSDQQHESVGNNISDKLSTSDHSSIPVFCNYPIEVLLWFQQNKLLKSVWSCDSCCNLMNWSESSRSRYGFEWTCQTKSCAKYQHSECITLGSIFSNSCVTLKNWLDIMYLWSENVTAKVTSKLVDISYKQINNCYASLREICQIYLIENPIKLGGHGITIEIDVATFSGNSKNNQTKSPIMVLGIIDYNSSPLKGYIEIVESSDTAALLPVILNIVEPGSIIYSKQSKECRKALGVAEIDKILDQSVNFLDIDPSEHVTKLQIFWDRHKSYLNTIHGCKQEEQNSYIQELMWRERFYDDSFKSLCQHIAIQYPL